MQPPFRFKNFTITLLCSVFFLWRTFVWGQVEEVPTVYITAGEGTFAEFYAPYTIISVTRLGDLSEPLEVKYTVSGTARNGIDYERLSGSVTIPAGEFSWPLVINAIDDPETEDPETLEVNLIPSTAPFTVVVLPDTQHYTAEPGFYGGSPDMFTSQTQWIIDNKTQTNIAFVLHEGDCTENNREVEWQRARYSMSLLDGVVPYAVVVGNHDGINDERNDTRLFNQYFSITNYQDLSFFGGVFETNRMDNAYHYFSAGGVDWLVVSLEFGPRDEVLEWANTVVANHPSRRVIFLSHTHLYRDNTLHGSKSYHWAIPTNFKRENDGTHVWDKLVRLHENNAFFFNGHVYENGDGQGRLIGVGDHGNRVYQMLCNYQGNVNGGCGFLRYITFYPDEDRLEAKSFSPVLNRFVTDDENQFEYRNLGVFTNIAPTYAIDPSRGRVSIEILSDEIDTIPPTVKSVGGSGNPAEITVLFDEPVDRESAEVIANYSINSPVPITNAILAADLKTVLLTCNTSLVPMATYTLTVNGVRDHTFQSNQMTAPVSRPFLYFPVLYSENFADTNLQDWTVVDEGTISFPSIWSVVDERMFQFANIYSLVTNISRRGTFAYLNRPFSFGWKDYAVSMTLNNADNDGIGLMFRYQNRSNYYKLEFDGERSNRRLTKVVNGIETMLANQGGFFPVNRDVKVRVTAYGNVLTINMDGTVIFGGLIMDGSLNHGTIALFGFGSVGMRFDDILVTTQNPAPQVSIATPAEGANFAYGSPVPISVNASDVNGIARVEIFNGNVLLKTFTNAPFSFTWSNAPSGEHELIARATDIFDAMNNSQPVRIVTGTGPPVFILQPNDQVVNRGHGVVFKGLAEGVPPVRYQWLFEGNPIPGATNRTFFLNDVREANVGNYALQATGPTASAISQLAALGIVDIDTPPAANSRPVLTLEERDVGGMALFSLYGPIGVVGIDVSTNLQTWTSLLTVTNGAGRVFFTDPYSGDRRRFYRAISTQ